MRVIDITTFQDSVVLHFIGEGNRINAYTLATTLVAFADAAKAANASINVGHEVEVVVEALGTGSFRVKVKAIYSAAKNLFSKENLNAIVIGIVSNYIFMKAFTVDEKVNVVVNTNEVIIERGDERLIVPRTVYDATRSVEKSADFKGAMARTFSAIGSDPRIEAFGIVKDMDSPPPDVVIPKKVIQDMDLVLSEEPPHRVVTENCELQIVKAVLERGRRKWEFMWRGIKISAPITCSRFYREFFAHEITIAPGDSLKVTLQIKQIRDERGIYSNVGYEVVEVHDHVPRVRQMPLTEETSGDEANQQDVAEGKS